MSRTDQQHLSALRERLNAAHEEAELHRTRLQSLADDVTHAQAAVTEAVQRFQNVVELHRAELARMANVHTAMSERAEELKRLLEAAVEEAH